MTFVLLFFFAMGSLEVKPVTAGYYPSMADCETAAESLYPKYLKIRDDMLRKSAVEEDVPGKVSHQCLEISS
ncbi:MAG: hypothetical protein V7752_21605 [Halopseudomonas sp.]